MPNAGEDQLAQLQRPGLALDDGRVVIAYGQNSGDCPGPNGPAHGYVVSIPEQGGPLHSPTMQLESNFHPRDWQTLSGDDLDLGTGDPALVDGFVLQVGKTDTAYLLRQGHLGGQAGEVASHSVCSGNPDGGHAVDGSVVYLPCPNGITAIKVLPKAPYLKQLWTDNDGAAGPPIIADGLIWTIGSDSAVHGLNPANGKQVVSIPYGAVANHFPTPSVADGLLLLPGIDQVFAFTGPAGLPPAPAS